MVSAKLFGVESAWHRPHFPLLMGERLLDVVFHMHNAAENCSRIISIMYCIPPSKKTRHPVCYISPHFTPDFTTGSKREEDEAIFIG